MIDINVVNANGKYYSVKCNLIIENNEGKKVVTAKILSLDLVEPTGSTSFKKLRTIFQTEGNDMLSKLKYPYIYEAITQKLIQKYRMQVLNI